MWICDEVVIKYKFRVMVCLVGINDLGNINLRSLREIVLNVKKIIDLVKGNFFNIKIVFVSILLCNEKL